MKTVFTTPLIQPLLTVIAKVALRLSGWKLAGELPKEKKYLLIGAPHTSNWDFCLMLCLVLSRRMSVNWMGKQQLFRSPFHHFMRWLGGIPVERSKANNTVEQMVNAFNKADEMILIITPEGTRSKVSQWKTGFYHIAQQAQVPIVQGYIDASKKHCGFGPRLEPNGDIEQDMAAIKTFYRDKHGIRPALGLDSDTPAA